MPAELKEIEVSEPQDAIINSPKQINLFLAGVGSGKSHVMGVVSAGYIINFPKSIGIMCANTYTQLSLSTLVRVFKVWAQYFGLIQDVHYVVDKQPPSHYEKHHEKLKSYKNVISWYNGAMTFVASLDNYKALDGMELGWGMLDETKDTKEEAVKEVILARLRQNEIYISEDNELYDHKPDDIKVKGFNPLYTFTSPAKVQWLNKMFKINENLEEISRVIFDKDDYYVGDFGDMRVVISSTYHNEHNLPDNYIDTRREIWDLTPGLSEMLIYASPVGKTGGEWYARYDRKIHIKKDLKVNAELPLHVAFDFNVNPYMSALDIQLDISDDGHTTIRVLKEYALEYPNNTTADVCNDIIFEHAGVINSIYYYGDATGKNRITATMDKSIRHNYDVIRAVLADFLFSGSNRVPNGNPPVAGRRILMNRIFSDKGNVSIVIDESCVQLIQDIDFGKEGPNGEYLKPKFRDEDKKVSFEKYGHHSDCLVYFCWYLFNGIIKIN